MASAQFTDEELFSELKRFGFTPGPVTENTRPVYLKKLKKLREEQEQHGSRSGKRRSSGYLGGSSYPGSRPDCYDVTRPGSSSRPGRKSSVLSFSSDESDAENTLKIKAHIHNNRMDRSPKFPTQSKSRSVSKAAAANRSPFSGSVGCAGNSDESPDGDRQKSVSSRIQARSSLESKTNDSDSPRNECRLRGRAVKKPRSFNGCGASQLSPGRVPGDYSDSDEEELEGIGAGDPQRGASHTRPTDLQVPLLPGERGSRPAAADRGIDANLKAVVRQREEGDIDLQRVNLGVFGNARAHSLSRRSINLSSAEMCDDADQNNHVEGNHGASRGSTTSRVSLGLRPRFSNYSGPSQTYRGNHSNHSVPNHSYSQALPGQPAAVPEEALLQQFRREEVASSARFSAHYLSMSLLTAACLFFLLLGLMYLRMRGSGSADVDGVGTCLTGRFGRLCRDILSPDVLSVFRVRGHLPFIPTFHIQVCVGDGGAVAPPAGTHIR